MGQSFLINKETATSIVNLIDFSKHDCVIEIGPGKGALTYYLATKKIKVVAIELDKRLAEYIKKTYPKINLINDDILNVDLDKLFSQYANPILISNLPYSISSPLLVKYLHLTTSPNFICMFQKEFADRLIALPQTKQYGALSVVTQIYLDCQKLMEVNKNNFNPKPKVDSVVVKISRQKDKNIDEKFVNFIKKCFSAKRKTLFNNLKSHYDNLLIKNSMTELGLIKTDRAEAIHPRLFMELFNKINHGTKSI